MAPKKYRNGHLPRKSLDYYLTSPKNIDGLGYHLRIRETKTRTKIDKVLFLDPIKGIVYIDTYRKGHYIKTTTNTIKRFVERYLLDDIVERLTKFDIHQLAKPTSRAVKIYLHD